VRYNRHHAVRCSTSNPPKIFGRAGPWERTRSGRTQHQPHEAPSRAQPVTTAQGRGGVERSGIRPASPTPYAGNAVKKLDRCGGRRRTSAGRLPTLVAGPDRALNQAGTTFRGTLFVRSTNDRGDVRRSPRVTGGNKKEHPSGWKFDLVGPGDSQPRGYNTKRAEVENNPDGTGDGPSLVHRAVRR